MAHRSRRPSASRPSLRLLGPRGEWVDLLYVADGDQLFVIPSEGAPGWSSHVLRVGSADVLLPNGSRATLSAGLEIDPRRAEEARAAFRAKYGPAVWGHHFPLRTNVIVLRPPPVGPARTPMERVREEFDATAPHYRERTESDPVESHLKARSVALLLREFAGRDPLLEIGPGAGVETLPLLRAGHHVTAVDISPKMLEQLVARARTAGVAERLTPRVGQLRTIATDLSDTPTGSFSGGFSTFGALNLEPELDAAAPGIARLLSPGSVFVAGVLNRFAATPLTFELLRGGPRPLMARLGRPVLAEDIRYPLDIWPWSIPEYDRSFAPFFERVGVAPVSALAPPFRADRFLARLSPRARRTLVSLDDALVRSVWGRRMSEWLLLLYRRTRVPARSRS
jgi:SAM-dependent methyltransferase